MKVICFLVGLLCVLEVRASDQRVDEAAPDFATICNKPMHKNKKFKLIVYQALYQHRLAQKIEYIKALTAEQVEHAKAKKKKVGMYPALTQAQEHQFCQLKDKSRQALRKIAMLEHENKQFKKHIVRRLNVQAPHLISSCPVDAIAISPFDDEQDDQSGSSMCTYKSHKQLQFKCAAYLHAARSCKNHIIALKRQFKNAQVAHIASQQELVLKYQEQQVNDGSYLWERFELDTLVARKNIGELVQLNAHYKEQLKELLKNS